MASASRAGKAKLDSRVLSDSTNQYDKAGARVSSGRGNGFATSMSSEHQQPFHHAPRPAPMMRQSSSSSGKSTTRADDEAGAYLRPPSASTETRKRRGSSRSSTRESDTPPRRQPSQQPRRNVPMGPPIDAELYNTDEEWRVHHEQEKQSSWHHVPLILVALPPLGAIVHGRAENWSDAIILILVCFYLYQLIKVPWDIYHASHSRKVLEQAIDHDMEQVDPVIAMRRERAAHSLRRNELVSLLATFLVPAVGAYLLVYIRGLLSDPDRYINSSLISLFILATSVKPLLHFGSLVKSNSLYHQEVVHYPSTEVHFLRRRVEALEKDLSQLTRAFATKDDVRNLRDGVDVPLSALNKAVRRFDRREELLRLTSEERFLALEQRIEKQKRELEQNAVEIEHIRHETLTNPINTVFKIIHTLAGSNASHHRGGKGPHQRSLRWYERGPLFYLLFPVNVGNRALEWVSTKSESGDDDDEYVQDGDYNDRADVFGRRPHARAQSQSAMSTMTNSPRLLQSPIGNFATASTKKHFASPAIGKNKQGWEDPPLVAIDDSFEQEQTSTMHDHTDDTIKPHHRSSRSVAHVPTNLAP